MTTYQKIEVSDLASRIRCKLLFLIDSLLDLETDALPHRESILGLVYFLEEIQKETEIVNDFLEKIQE